MGFLEWFTIITGAATLISLAIGVSAWKATKSFNLTMAGTQERMHVMLQQTLATIHTETQRTLSGINQTLDHIDQRAEERYRNLRGRLDGEV